MLEWTIHGLFAFVKLRRTAVEYVYILLVVVLLVFLYLSLFYQFM